MQKIKYVMTVIFLGLCIIVGLNFNLFLNKTSNFIYVVSGQQERDIKVQEQRQQEANKREMEKLAKEYEIRTEKDLIEIKKLKDLIIDEKQFILSKEKINNLFNIKVINYEDNFKNITNVCDRYSSSKIQFTNNSNQEIESITLSLKAYSSDLKTEFYSGEGTYKFQYFLSPEETLESYCASAHALRKDDYDKLIEKDSKFILEIIDTSKFTTIERINKNNYYGSWNKHEILNLCNKYLEILDYHYLRKNKDTFNEFYDFENFCYKFL